MMDGRPGLDSAEVLYSDGAFRAVTAETIELLKARAAAAPRKRCRLCLHRSPDSAHHAMLIVMHASSYVRPHRHFGKTETLTVIEGAAEAILFNADGTVKQVVVMSSAGAGRGFLYFMPEGVFHALVVRSDWLVFLETTIGPFDPAMSEPAPWAPPETDSATGLKYLAALRLLPDDPER